MRLQLLVSLIVAGSCDVFRWIWNLKKQEESRTVFEGLKHFYITSLQVNFII
jgi:hypothetical protein